MSTVAYEIVDVFTDRPFAGNPLAVVYGAEALAGDQMQTIAREFNLSETVFVLPSTAATYRARIFTPETELPFAGHPSIGAAVTTVRRGQAKSGRVVQDCGAGLLPIEVSDHGTATLTGGQPTLGDPLDPEPLLALVGLTTADYAGGDAVPRPAGCGLEFIFVPGRKSALARPTRAPPPAPPGPRRPRRPGGAAPRGGASPGPPTAERPTPGASAPAWPSPRTRPPARRPWAWAYGWSTPAGCPRPAPRRTPYIRAWRWAARPCSTAR